MSDPLERLERLLALCEIAGTEIRQISVMPCTTPDEVAEALAQADRTVVACRAFLDALALEPAAAMAAFVVRFRGIIEAIVRTLDEVWAVAAASQGDPARVREVLQRAAGQLPDVPPR